MRDAALAAKDILQLVRMSPVIAAETIMAQGLTAFAAEQTARAEAAEAQVERLRDMATRIRAQYPTRQGILYADVLALCDALLPDPPSGEPR